MVYVEIGGQMTINGQPFLPFKGTRCANNLDTSGVVKPQVQVSWQPGTDASKAACRAFDFFQDSNCNGQLLGSFPDGKSRTMTLPGTVKSARCIIDDLCPYVSCPPWSKCIRTTDDSAYASAIPVVDLSAGEAACAAAVDKACREVGFFLLANHGVPRQLMADAFHQTRLLFGLPAEAKAAVRQDSNNRGYTAFEEEVLDPAGSAGATRGHQGGLLRGAPAPPFNNRGYTAFEEEVLDPAVQRQRGDTKEGYYVGVDIPPHDPRAAKPLHGPNVWPPADLLAFRPTITAYFAACLYLTAQTYPPLPPLLHPLSIICYLLPAFRPTITAYFSACLSLARRLLPILALALGQPRDFFNLPGRFDDPIVLLRLLHYSGEASRPQEGVLGAGAHTDYGMLTLLLVSHPGLEPRLPVFLFSTSVFSPFLPATHPLLTCSPLPWLSPSLQICVDRSSTPQRWVRVPVVPGTYIVNIGDMLERWSNASWRSTLHRVLVLPEGEEGEGKDGGSGACGVEGHAAGSAAASIGTAGDTGDTGGSGVGQGGSEVLAAGRVSLPFFFEPNFDCLVDCVPSRVNNANPARFPPTTSGHYLLSRYQATHKDLHASLK
ncbi:unnamed protein product [Closterium sp. Naga37s-1]|nr:unnamed protein product [Closterium sp. Naga37s-1]